MGTFKLQKSEISRENERRIFPYVTLVLTMLLICFLPAAADTDLPVIDVDHRVSYMCGDTFELSFPDVISTGTMFTNASMIQATAKKDESLLQVRIQIRNMTTSFFHGIDSQSFRLTGYVRDRSLSYTPEIILNTDYFGRGNYFNWDQLPPLRQADILLVFRVNPILINWELTFVPQLTADVNYEFERVTYKPMKADPCAGLFRFSSVRNLETGVLTTFER